MRLSDIMENKAKTAIDLRFDPADGFCTAFLEPGYVFLNALYASRKGGGARMLQKVIDYATERALPIELLADGDDDLTAYYERFGFERVGNASNNRMRLETTGRVNAIERNTLRGCINYDGRDGELEADFGDGLADTTAIIITKLTPSPRSGALLRLLDSVFDYALSQRYPIQTDLDLPSEIMTKSAFTKQGDTWAWK